ncbi:VCBS domain-containing protein [Crocosphaera sp.]|uniref:VCBS domain-containing protein n=1 Tax=Crocosphaera sp. TaxID=2729996 RepID=UPI003F237EA9
MISFQLDQFTGSDAKVLITLEELANGEVKLIVDVEDGILADIRGIFFNIADESLIDGLTVTGEDVTNTNSGEIGTSDEVDRVGNAVIRPAYYDYGVEIGTSGIGFDDISSTSFIISHVDQELSLEDFIGEEFGVRLTSVGDDREGSSKLTRILEIAPDENTVKEDSQPNPITGNVLFNDSDTSNLFVVSVNGETTLVGTEIQGEYGSLLLNADGSYSYTLDNNNPDVDGLDDGESLTEVFKYTNSDGDLTASAPLTITIEGTNDAPVANADVNLIVEDSPNNPVMGNVLENDVDVDGDMLSVVSVNGETALVGQEIKGEYGSLLLNADGSYSYTLDNNNPDVDGLDDGESLSEVFRYTNSDGDLTASAPLTITIEGVSDQPPIIDEPGGDSLSARTPGFWSNHTELWDGDLTNDAKGGAGKEDFPLQDLLYSSVDPVTGESSKGLLIGDFNHDGLTNNNERTLFYSHEEALELVDASRKISKQDARYILGRSLIASWLNNLAGTPSPIDDIQDGIDWLQSHTMDENNDGLGDGNLVLGANIYGVQSKSLDWSGSPENDTGLPSGESIHTALDQYNNFGLV